MQEKQVFFVISSLIAYCPKLPAADRGERTGGADLQIGSGAEGYVGRQNLGNGLVEQFVETRAVGRYIEDSVATEAERGVIIFGIGMLDEEQGRGDRDVRWKMADGRCSFAPDDISIEQRLQIIIGMIMNILRQENGIDIRHGLDGA